MTIAQRPAHTSSEIHAMAAVMSPVDSFPHRAPWWLPGGHLQTILPSLIARATVGAPPKFRRERWTTPDQDFIDVDFLVDPPGTAAPAPDTRPTLVLFHGLEGSSQSGYAKAFACLAR